LLIAYQWFVVGLSFAYGWEFDEQRKNPDCYFPTQTMLSVDLPIFLLQLVFCACVAAVNSF